MSLPEKNADPLGQMPEGLPVPQWQRIVLVLLMVALASLWGYASWIWTEDLINERSALLIEQRREVATDTAVSLGAHVGATLAYMRGIPKVLAKQSEVQDALSRMGPDVQRSRQPAQQFRAQVDKTPDFARLNKRLESILSDLDVEQVLVINAAGDCVASAGYPEEASPVGVNYRDRKYFQQARQEEAGRQFAVGRTTNLPGIFYSSAVVLHGRFHGVVAVRINVSQLSRMGIDKNTLITDENQVVVVSGNPAYYMKALPGSKLETFLPDELESIYHRPVIQSMEIESIEVSGVTLSRLEGHKAPMIEAVSHTPSDVLSIRVYQDLSELKRIKSDGDWIFALIFLVGISLLVCILASVIYLRRRREHQFDIARFNAELVKLNEVLLLQARFDALTGCGNRRYFFEELGLELQRASRFAYSCCLAMIDIDHFKSVNDLYGHAAGDAVLKHFVHTVSTCLRSSDLLGRLGGEEFALLMPQTTLAGAVELAERVRKTVEQSSALFGSFEIRFAVSIGVVQSMGAGDEVEAFVARADHAMYAAKHSGRNRVCSEALDSPDDGSMSV
ncbi:MAG: diguanylate cyclase [Betaproteobacteria bacterium]